MAKQKEIAHIHLHTIYSIADAMSKPEQLAKRAHELGIKTLFVTDHGTISGIIQMKKAADKYGLKFIPGAEMYEAYPSRLQKVSRKETFHITMIPVNNQGYADLTYLLADANKEGFYYDPRTDIQFIEENDLGKNIIATSGCLGGYIPGLIMDGKYDEAKKEAKRRNKVFYKYYLEVQDNGSREQDMVNMQLIQMSKETGIPLVYAKDVHYVMPEHKSSHHAMVAIGRKQNVTECTPYPGTNTYHLAGADEVYAWADENNIPHEALENTVKIAEMCNVDIELGKDLMPEYPYVAKGHTPATYLKKLLYDYLLEYIEKQRAKGKILTISEYISRIEKEYSVITLKKFPSYFLILWDILGWATDRKKWASIPENAEWLKIKGNEKYMDYPEYLIGPGRGSAAGSLMAFLLNITKLDPLEYDLLFERFLNPYRNSPPDIDVDFPGDFHELLLDFVAQRYGRDRTAQIKTFTYFKLRSAIDKLCKALEVRDATGKRILKYGYKVADEIKKSLEVLGDQGMLPNGKPATYDVMMDVAVNPDKYEDFGNDLPKMIEASKEFRWFMNKYPELNEYLPKVEGAIDTSGIHAGGVIISKRPLSLDVPTILPRDGSKAVLPITEFDYPDCEEVGLLKMDLLRTSTLRIISMSLDLIKQNTGEAVDVYDIGRDDDKTFELIASGKTHGLFQINGHGITQYTRQVSPTTQLELIDIAAIYRPGPLNAKLENGNTIAQQYVLNGSVAPKRYLKDVHPEIRPLLKISRGQMIYQEQIMLLTQVVAGYNLGDADTFRRVIGKKKIDVVKTLYDDFVYGHKFVLNKWQKALDKLKKSGKDTVKVYNKFKDDYDTMTELELNNAIKSTKADMDKHEIVGAVNNGYSEKFADNLFRQMAAFAEYGFNRSHSACYADEAYQTAYLKAHYPVEFMSALLTIRSEGASAKDKTLENLKECKRMGIKVLPPNINKSFREFTPEGDGIRFGLLSIDGAGATTVDAIIEEREKDGDFKSFDDFVKRFTYKGSKVKRGNFRALIQAGAFDEFEENRYKLLNYYNFEVRGDKIYGGTEEELEKSKEKSNHSYLYDEKSFHDKLRLEMERNLIGIYVSGSPYEGLPYTSLDDMSLSDRRNKEYYRIGGRITKISVIKTKKGQDMAFVTLETQLEPFEVTLFSDAYEEVAQHLYKDNIVVFKGYKNKSFYKGEEREQFIGEKVLVKEANKLKKELGVANKQNKAKTEPKENLFNVPEPKPKPKAKADPVAELFDKPKKKKKRTKGVDLFDY